MRHSVQPGDYDLDEPRRGRRGSTVGDSVLTGAVAGLIGGAAMKMEQKALIPEEERMDPPPSRQDPKRAAVSVLAYMVYGVTTAKAFEALH